MRVTLCQDDTKLERVLIRFIVSYRSQQRIDIQQLFPLDAEALDSVLRRRQRTIQDEQSKQRKDSSVRSRFPGQGLLCLESARRGTGDY